MLLIGAGGLGSPTALYLAAAGVGTLGLMDGDVVDVSNLQRQVLHTTANVGRPKVDSGAETIQALRKAYKVVFRDGLTLDAAYPLLEELARVAPEVNIFIDSLRASTRGIIR